MAMAMDTDMDMARRKSNRAGDIPVNISNSFNRIGMSIRQLRS